jgi:hypothetical protein
VARANRAPTTPTFFWYRPEGGTVSGSAVSDVSARIERVDADRSRHEITLPRDSTLVAGAQWVRISEPFTFSTSDDESDVVEVGRDLEPSPRKDQGIGGDDWLSIPFYGLGGRVASEVSSRLSRGDDGRSRASGRGFEVTSWLLALLGSLAGLAVAFAIGRRYAFNPRRVRTWNAIGLAVGPLGLLLMWSLIEWPALEPCASCGRKRVVTRERCQHCGELFLAPARDGTEIFEPLSPRTATVNG